MKMIRFAYLAGAAVLGLTLGMASNMMGAEYFRRTVEREFMAGFQGDAAALVRGMKLCEEALAKDANNADALVWHGAGLYFGAGQAASTGDYETAGELMHEGLGEMDKAVTLQPDSMSVRITRGMTLLNAARYGAPDPQSLFSTVRTDLEKVIASAGNEWNHLPAPLRAEILLGLADACNGTGDAAKAKIYMERVTAEYAGTPQAERAQTWLAKN